MKTLNDIEKELLSLVIANDAKIFKVGGSVRDELMGLSQEDSKDLDVMIVGMEIEDIKNLLSTKGKVDLVGKSFGVIKFTPHGWKDEPVDISVPRLDKKTGDKHTDFEIEVGAHVTIEQDQKRRDFTMNALLKDLQTGEIIDFNNGQGSEDIKNRIIRMTSLDSMKEDPLRMLRAIQFASRFNFTIEVETFNSIARNAKLISSVSKERILIELEKLFMKSPKPSIGVELFRKSLLSSFAIPNLPDECRNELFDVIPKDFDIFLSVLFGGIRDISLLKKVLFELTVPRDSITSIVETFSFFLLFDSSDKAIVSFNNNIKREKSLKMVDTFLTVDGFKSIIKRLNAMREKGIPTCFKELSVTGDDLLKEGFKGKEIGKELERLLLEPF